MGRGTRKHLKYRHGIERSFAIPKKGSFRRCPDMPDGKIESAPIDLFLWEGKDKNTKDLHAFILTLSLIFNDLKGIMWMHFQVNKGKPADIEKPTSYLGNHNGITWQLSRLAFGLFVELLREIKEHEKVISGPAFLRIIADLDGTSKQAWHDLLKAADGKIEGIETDRDLFTYFETIRSNGIYHYSSTGLLLGYGRFFTSDMRNSDHAYFASGKSLEATRWFFADAASQGQIMRATDNLSQSHKVDVPMWKILDGFIPRINFALRFIVEGFIRLREEELSSIPSTNTDVTDPSPH